MKFYLLSIITFVYVVILPTTSTLFTASTVSKQIPLLKVSFIDTFKGVDSRHSLEQTEEDILQKLEIAYHFQRLATKERLEKKEISLEDKLEILRTYELPLCNSLSKEVSPISIHRGGLCDDWERDI